VFEKDLANATALWLAYKRISGFNNLLSEGLLIIPVVEFLIGQGYTGFEAEPDAYRLFGLGGGGAYAAYDLKAESGSCTLKHIILEMKLLTSVNDPRIITDFVKLAVPPHNPATVVFFSLPPMEMRRP
jgi:hypothetical protein